MTSASPGRAWPMLDASLFGAALLLYAFGMPLGLARVEVAPPVAAAIGLDTSEAAAPLALLATRYVQLLPLGDQPLRANLASALLCALAIALLGRLCVEVLALLRPSVNARQGARDFLHEPVAGAAGALAAGLSLSTFELATAGGTAAATLLLLVGGLLAGLALLRDCTSALAGCALAGLAGLSVGVDLVAGPLLWPLLVGFAVWALRMGGRWPLLAPLGFVAAWSGAALAQVACSSPPAGLRDLFAGLGNVEAHLGAGLWLTLVELGDEVGVVGALLAGIGLVVIGFRSALVAAWLALMLISALLFAHPWSHSGSSVGPSAASLPLAITISCALASAGLVHVAGRLGRARLAAALALAVMLVLTPILDGGRARWFRNSTVPMRLLDHALARAEIRSVVDPGTNEIHGLFRLARAMGLRPDLVIGKPHKLGSRPDRWVPSPE